jgi:hypothetical protein
MKKAAEVALEDQPGQVGPLGRGPLEDGRAEVAALGLAGDTGGQAGMVVEDHLGLRLGQLGQPGQQLPVGAVIEGRVHQDRPGLSAGGQEGLGAGPGLGPAGTGYADQDGAGEAARHQAEDLDPGLRVQLGAQSHLRPEQK